MEKKMILKYDRTAVNMDGPTSVDWGRLVPLSAAPVTDERILPAAIAELRAQDKVRQVLARPCARITLVVPDHTRYCSLPEILAHLLPELQTHSGAQIEVLIANGTHSVQAEAVARATVGARAWAELPIRQHDCHNKSALAFAGETTRGTPVWLDQKVLTADLVITIGGVLFHYFAGFGGGPKMLLPGVAGYETTLYNHRRTIDPQTGDFHQFCYEGNIETNPVYLDLAEIERFVPQAISLQVVLDLNKKFAAARVGPLVQTHRDLAATVKSLYEIPMAAPADVVVASAGGFPADVNLIQAHKSIHHAFAAVKHGGALVILAACSEGIGSSSFLRYFDGSDAKAIGRRLLSDFQLNGHTALALKRKTEAATIILISELAPEIVRQCGMIPASNLSSAWTILTQRGLTAKTGYIFENAAHFVPTMTENN